MEAILGGRKIAPKLTKEEKIKLIKRLLA